MNQASLYYNKSYNPPTTYNSSPASDISTHDGDASSNPTSTTLDELVGVFNASSSMRVKTIEVSRQYRNRHGKRENTCNSASGPYQFTQYPYRYFIPVPHCRHRNDGPPEGVWDAVDRGVVDSELSVVDGARVDESMQTSSTTRNRQSSLAACFHSQNEHLHTTKFNYNRPIYFISFVQCE